MCGCSKTCLCFSDWLECRSSARVPARARASAWLGVILPLARERLVCQHLLTRLCHPRLNKAQKRCDARDYFQTLNNRISQHHESRAGFSITLV